MVNLNVYQTMHKILQCLIKQHVVTDDDALIQEAFQHNNIHHVCQPIRETSSGDVVFQHVTLRFGGHGEQSVYSFDLSDGMRHCLDLYSLYLALRQSRFQLDTFHPDLFSHVVVPIDANALLWPQGQRVFNQLLQLDKVAFSCLIPSLQIEVSDDLYPPLTKLLAILRGSTFALWFDISVPCNHIDFMAANKPDMVKLAITITDKQERASLLPVIRFFRSHRLPWVAGRVASQNELNQYKVLGATYYFGYFSDIPTSLSSKAFLSVMNSENVE